MLQQSQQGNVRTLLELGSKTGGNLHKDMDLNDVGLGVSCQWWEGMRRGHGDNELKRSQTDLDNRKGPIAGGRVDNRVG